MPIYLNWIAKAKQAGRDDAAKGLSPCCMLMPSDAHTTSAYMQGYNEVKNSIAGNVKRALTNLSKEDKDA